MPVAKGKFDVKRTPIVDADGEPALQRFRLDKTFYGALSARSRGMMLAMGNASGSAGYVAMERVEGTLDGKRGSFALQHSGTMDRGRPSLVIIVVPDSGTDELTGLSGFASIDISTGVHEYTFEYELRAAS